MRHGTVRRHGAPTICSLTVLVGALGLLLAGGGSIEEPNPLGCEPGGLVTVSARVLSVNASPARATAIVEVTVHSLVNVARSRVHADLRGPGRRGPRRRIPDRELALPRGSRRELLYEVELAPFRDHDLFFSVESEDGPDLQGATAHVRIPLDPARRPRRHDGLIEYAASMEPGSGTGEGPGTAERGGAGDR